MARAGVRETLTSDPDKLVILIQMCLWQACCFPCVSNILNLIVIVIAAVGELECTLSWPHGDDVTVHVFISRTLNEPTMSTEQSFCNNLSQFRRAQGVTVHSQKAQLAP